MVKQALLSTAFSLLTLSSIPSHAFSLLPTAPQTPQHTHFLQWATDKEQNLKQRIDPLDVEPNYTEPVYLPLKTLQVDPLGAKEQVRSQQTSDLYFHLFGKDTIQSFLWTGIESGNPLTRHEEYRWNSLREEGLYDPANRQKLIQSLLKAGIRNIRLGISNHEIEIDKDSTWDETTRMIDDFYKAGINISLDLHHFGIEDRFRVVDAQGKTIGDKSYYLNRDWPEYFGRLARKAIEKYHRKIKAITLMNEPETVAGFNGEMWHGGYPGWTDGQSNKIYIQRSIQVAKASVLARIQIEDYLSQIPYFQRPRFLYLHTEASVHKKYWKDFNLYRRFIISDMILGQDWLVNADLNKIATTPVEEFVGRWHRLTYETRTNLDWVIENYLVYNQNAGDRESLRKDMVARLRELQNAHSKLKRRFGKTMKTDTVLGVDYYSHNEDRDGDLVKLNPEPQYYVSQIKAGRRVGLYQVLVEYYNRYQLPVMIGESGTPYYYYGSRWSQQVLLECAKAASQGIPFLGYTLYPAVDTWGWESALSVPRNQALHNPSGLVDLDFKVRPFVTPLMDSLKKTMPLTNAEQKAEAKVFKLAN